MRLCSGAPGGGAPGAGAPRSWTCTGVSCSTLSVVATLRAHAGGVADPFHVIRLANNSIDEVRRRTQNDTLGHRGRKDDPLYRARRLLISAHERLTERGDARLRGPPATTHNQPLRHPSPLLGARGAPLTARRHRTPTANRLLRPAQPMAVFTPPAPRRRIDPDALPPMRRARQNERPNPQPPPAPRRQIRALPRRHHHRTLLRRPRHPQQHPTRQLPERALRNDRVEAQLRPAKPNRKHQLPATPQRRPPRRNVPVAQQNAPRHRSARPSSHLQPRPQCHNRVRRHAHADRDTTDSADHRQRT